MPVPRTPFFGQLFARVSALVVGAPTGGNKGAGTLNVATAYYVAGQLTTQVIQQVNTQTGAVATGTTVLPHDDTITQSGEGDQYMSLAITPKSTANILVIDVVVHASHSATTRLTAALFQDATAGALAAAVNYASANGQISELRFQYWMLAGTVSATTFKVRVGGNSAGTTSFNGEAGARYYGGVLVSSITITEYTP